MNRSELINELSKKAKISQKECDCFLTTFCEVVTSELKKGGSVVLVGFGKWEVRKRAKRNSYNPHTKKMMIIPATKVPTFRPGNTLKSAVNKSK